MFDSLRHRLAETDGVDVWFIALDRGAKHVRQCAELLSGEEGRRAERIVHDAHRRRWIVARGALRMLLGNYTGESARAIRFSYGEYGKPSLSAHPDLHFNLSHSGDLAVLAVTRIAPIGVDVEDCRRSVHDRGTIVRRFFSVDEQRAYLRLPRGQRRAGFFRGWTRKEAYIKALGTGLTTPLESFDVTLTPGEQACLRRIEDKSHAARDWSIFHLHAVPDYVGAIALQSGPGVQLRQLWFGVGDRDRQAGTSRQ